MSAVVSPSLPYPPSANKLWRFVPGNRTPLKSREYRDWQAAADRCIVMADRGLIRGPHRIEIVAFRPDRRARDIDNLTKPILDAIKDGKLLKGLIRDDSDTQKISIEWAPDEPSSQGILVTVTAA